MRAEFVYTVFRTRWGYFGLFGTEKGLFRSCLPLTSRQKAKRKLLRGADGAERDGRIFAGLEERVKAYFEGGYVDFSDVKADLSGFSPFGKKVLRACRKVTHAKTATYGQLAEIAGSVGASQAVGSILGKNPLPLIIPCHRVIRADGDMGGFSATGGVNLKKRMLKLEAISA